MKKFSFERIEHDEKLLEQFSDRVAQYTGVRIPTEYNKSAETWGLFVDGSLQGGYAIASGRIMRVPLIVPEQTIKNSAFMGKYQRTDWCEVNQVWLSDEIKKYSVSLKLWLHIRNRLLKSGHSIVFIPWKSQNVGIDKFYRGFTSHILFQGPPAGKVGHSFEIIVGLATMHDIRWSTLKFFPAFIRKISSGQKRATRLEVKPEDVVQGQNIRYLKLSRTPGLKVSQAKGRGHILPHDRIT